MLILSSKKSHPISIEEAIVSVLAWQDTPRCGDYCYRFFYNATKKSLYRMILRDIFVGAVDAA